MHKVVTTINNTWIYDCEVFAHDWIFVAKQPVEGGERIILYNDAPALRWWADAFGRDELVIGGYNTKHYDQWILRAIYTGATLEQVKEINDWIIGGQKGWDHPYFRDVTWPPWTNFDLMDDIPVPLRLKEIEGNLGMDVEESRISFDIDRPLTEAERNEVIEYCCHDVDAAIRLYHERESYLQSKINVGAMCGLSPAQSLRLTNAKLTAEFLGAREPQEAWPDRDVYEFPDNLIITKYPEVIEFFADVDPERKRKLEIEIAGVPHTIAWGGLHGARECYLEERTETRRISSRDVTSYYPSLMIVNGYMSRNVPDPDEFKRVYERRIEAKKSGDKATADALKLVLNTTYGAMNNQYNKLYDPRMALAVCVSGQLYLIDLIEKLEDVSTFRLIQSNTDGLIISYDVEHEAEIDAVINEWSKRTGFGMEADEVEKIVQKDVNNYVLRTVKGKIKVKGGYVSVYEGKDLWKQNSLAIVAKAIVANLMDGTPPEETINACNDMEQFQIVCKAGSTYDKVIWISNGNEVEVQNVNRVFASINKDAGTLYKIKLPKQEGEKERRDKIANLPDHCFIANRSGYKIGLVDKQFYIDLAQKRINDYLGIKPEKPKKERKTKMVTKEKTKETQQVAPQGLAAKLMILREKMNSFTWEKDGKNRHQSYEYITEKQYKNNFKVALAAAGLDFKSSILEYQFIPQISDKMNMVIAKFQFEIIDRETDEREIYQAFGSGADTGDKGLYKAYTGAIKYFLANNYLVAEGNDPENDETEMRAIKPVYVPPARREEIRDAITNQDEPATEEQLEAIALGIEALQAAGVDEETIVGFTEALQGELTKADAEQLLDVVTELVPV